MKCKVRSVLLPLILLLPYVLSSGYVPTAQPAPEQPAEPVLTQPLEIEGSFSQEAEVQYVEELGATRLVLSYEAGDLPYIPQLCTILAAKDAPGEAEGEPLSYSSVSVNNAWGKDGNFSYGSWVFIIHEAFEPAAYYDIQLHGYEKPLAQAEVIEIPIQQ